MPPEIWDVDTKRQATYEIHRQTRSIRLAQRWQLPSTSEPSSADPSGDLTEEILAKVPAGLQAAAWAIAHRLESHFGGRTTTLLLAQLPPGGSIPEHVDGGPPAMAHRCHVPVITNDRVHMFIDEVRYHFAPGIAYEFDNTLHHAVVNAGDDARVHLICDVV
jgi:hypothetical protein